MTVGGEKCCGWGHVYEPTEHDATTGATLRWGCINCDHWIGTVATPEPDAPATPERAP